MRQVVVQRTRCHFLLTIRRVAQLEIVTRGGRRVILHVDDRYGELPKVVNCRDGLLHIYQPFVSFLRAIFARMSVSFAINDDSKN